jgi:heme A synthase
MRLSSAAEACCTSAGREACVKQVHLVVGVTAIVSWGVVAMCGAWAWWRISANPWFWRLLRLAQAVTVVQVTLGGILVALGHKPPGLHVLYGVVPLLVSLVAEGLRAASAQTVLDARGYESARAVGKQPPEEQRAVVVAILRRELGLMAIAALVILVLLLRAAQTAG